KKDRHRVMNVVLTAYYNGKPDRQTGKHWPSDKSRIKTLQDSVDVPLFVMTDCLSGDEKRTNFIQSTCERPPNWQRWFDYLTIIEAHSDFDKLCLVDSTDTEMLNNPFEYIQDDKLYIGDESQDLGCDWMIENTEALFLKDFFTANKGIKLLNCGLLAGHRNV